MKGGVTGFLFHAIIVTGLVLATIFVLNRFQVTRNLVQTAIG
jgi:hypothetical protein